jgi:hypothetical protein
MCSRDPVIRRMPLAQSSKYSIHLLPHTCTVWPVAVGKRAVPLTPPPLIPLMFLTYSCSQIQPEQRPSSSSSEATSSGAAPPVGTTEPAAAIDKEEEIERMLVSLGASYSPQQQLSTVSRQQQHHCCLHSTTTITTTTTACLHTLVRQTASNRHSCSTHT